MSAAELELEKSQATVAELQISLEELRGVVEEAAKLKDQVDEWVSSPFLRLLRISYPPQISTCG